MENLIIELSKYLIIILFTVYTLYCFTVFRSHDKKRQNRVFTKQRVIMILIHLICYLLLYLDTKNIKILILYLCQLAFLLLTIGIYQLVYKKLSRLILNNMLMLLVISFVMLTRISYDSAIRQFVMAAAAIAVCLVVPFIMDRFKYLDRFGWIYAGAGLLLLLMVLVLGESKYGAKNWIEIAGFSLQPSEFVKIIFIFFIASLLSKRKDFKYVAAVSAVAAVHVLVLVAGKDLGAALIFFITYLFMLYIATEQPIYLISGLLAGSGAATLAYRMFDHVRVRVMAWKNPWADYDGGGYQVAQSLFAIGTGGWFGMGLGKGLPMSIPVRESDFIFAAISEELGGIFAVCIVLVYMSCFIMFVNISMKMKKPFYKLTAFGLSVQYIFQVLLNIGGVIKFIPSTGVTLPLISYGGSSVISVIIIFSIIQGLYVLSQEEDERNNHEQGNEKTKRKKEEPQPGN